MHVLIVYKDLELYCTHHLYLVGVGGTTWAQP